MHIIKIEVNTIAIPQQIKILAFCGILPADGFVLFAALTVAQGIVVPFFSGPFTSLLQTQFKPAYLGRVFSLFDSRNAHHQN